MTRLKGFKGTISQEQDMAGAHLQVMWRGFWEFLNILPRKTVDSFYIFRLLWDYHIRNRLKGGNRGGEKRIFEAGERKNEAMCDDYHFHWLLQLSCFFSNF